VKSEKSGLTLVELLTVLAIISLLVGILIPAVSSVKNSAMEAKQRGQFLTIELGLTTFKNDSDCGGDYPPSAGWSPGGPLNYCGAQKLAEALLGWDLLGFHPKSDFTANGVNSGGVFVYDSGDPVLFGQRKDPYLEGTANAFKLGSLFPKTGTAPLAPNTYVLCDVFGAKKVALPGGTTAKAGAPILYYRANTAGKDIFLKAAEDGKAHPLGDPGSGYGNFYGYITDPKIAAKQWPYKPNSYILISAGADGIYGTGDDVRNFGN
jgi:prepilin-type N-terminal cleavage/methylation domain-containing protein